MSEPDGGFQSRIQAGSAIFATIAPEAPSEAVELELRPKTTEQNRCPTFALFIWALFSLFWSIVAVPIAVIGTIMYPFYCTLCTRRHPVFDLWNRIVCGAPRLLDMWMEQQGWHSYD